MNQKNFEQMENVLEDEDLKIPVNDKRRFNEQGERIGGDDAAAAAGAEPTVERSAMEVELEGRLKAETERREAAESKLIGVQAKFEEAKANLERETADMRARLMRSLEDRASQSKFNFLQALLPVLDNLNLAVAASENDPSIEHLRTGVIGVARSFEQALGSVGVETVVSIGEPFDPEIHEAVDMVPTDSEQDGKIVSEYQKGYRFGDRLLRPAKVQVGRAVKDAAAE